MTVISIRSRIVGAAQVVALLSACTAAAAREPETEAWLLLGAGHDTNPTRRTDDGPDGAFAEARYDFEVDHVFAPRWKWFLDADGLARANESALSGGDRQIHDTRLGLALAPLSLREKRVLFQFGPTLRIDRNEFLDRETGERYTLTVPDGAGTREVTIPDRYDAETFGLFADAYWQPVKRMRLGLQTGWEQSRYREDYPEGSSLRPLDSSTVWAEPGIHYRVTRDLMLGLSVQLADTDYDEERARDATGDLMPDTKRHLRYADLSVTARWSPVERVRLSMSLRGGSREDAQEGYYDYSTRASYAQVEYVARPDLLFRLSGYWRDREDAEIPAADLEIDQRQSDRTRVRGTVQWKLRPYLGLYGELARQSDESWQPEYTYDQSWVLAGVTFHL
jgi:hypothetical protein